MILYIYNTQKQSDPWTSCARNVKPMDRNIYKTVQPCPFLFNCAVFNQQHNTIRILSVKSFVKTWRSDHGTRNCTEKVKNEIITVIFFLGKRAKETKQKWQSATRSGLRTPTSTWTTTWCLKQLTKKRFRMQILQNQNSRYKIFIALLILLECPNNIAV